MNKFICVANLTKDVELRYTKIGKVIATLSIAINYGYGDNKKTLFMRANAWEKKAEAIQNLTKGKKILIEGRLEPNEWTDKEGKLRTDINLTIENIEFLSPKEQTEQEENKYEKHYKLNNSTENVVIPGEEEIF